MPNYDWNTFLGEWNQDLLSRFDADEYDDAVLQRLGWPRDVIEAGWLGFPAASETEIEALEVRLNTRLPPSYRTFLATSNGFRQPDMLVPRIYSVHEIGWLRDIDPSVLATGHESFFMPLPVSDEDYFVYSDEQATFNMREEYVPSTLRISEREESGSAMYLLNPEIVTEDGEWEAWMMAHWLPGARRYRSFWDLMQGQRRILLWRGHPPIAH